MSRVVRVEESVRIARPPAEVWTAIADYGFDREWRKGLLEMTPDPPGPICTVWTSGASGVNACSSATCCGVSCEGEPSRR